jgi:hypothetical protein
MKSEEQSRDRTSDGLYKNITTLFAIIRILILIRHADQGDLRAKHHITLMEKHNEEYSVKSRFLRFAGQSVLRRGDYFVWLLLVSFRRQSGS